MIVNTSVGVMGHVDAGKTALCRALSQVLSTAALDKHPEAKARGITIDLGFSSFMLPTLAKHKPSFAVRCTLVDCPGHASLIKTVVGGAQIIDAILLVIDVAKGIQVQTAECLVLAEILTSHLIVALNKCDNVSAENIEKTIKKLRKTFAETKFGFDVPIIPVSAITPGSADSLVTSLGDLLFNVASKRLNARPELRDSEFVFAFDHCFPIKGQGTVFTGTVIHGKLRSGNEVTIPSSGDAKRVKSIQSFHESLKVCYSGDRCGLCLPEVYSEKCPDRGWLYAPGLMNHCRAVIAEVHRIKYFKKPVKSNSKFYVVIGHSGVNASCIFFRGKEPTFSLEKSYLSLDVMESSVDEKSDSCPVFAVLSFDKPIICPHDSRLVALILSKDPSKSKSCRIAFWGIVCHQITLSSIGSESSEIEFTRQSLKQLRVYKLKERYGSIEKVLDDRTLLVKDLLHGDISPFIGCNIRLGSCVGKILGSFGKADNGRIKVSFSDDLSVYRDEKGKLKLSGDLRPCLIFQRSVFNDKKPELFEERI